MSKPEIEVGDHVTVGPRGRKHWIVKEIFRDTERARLVSGMSGRRENYALERLVLFQKGVPNAEA